MANKNSIQNINLEGTLNLNKYQSDIKQFDGFNEKNASIFGNVLTPFFNTESSKYFFGVNNKIFSVDDTYDEDNIALYKEDTVIATLPKYSITKKIIDIDKIILAYEFDKNDNNIVHLFVEGENKYQFIDYNIESESIVSTQNTSINVGNISTCNMLDGNVVFYDNVDLKLHICNKVDEYSVSYDNDGSPICTINRLDDTFNVTVGDVEYPLYLICYCGRSGNLSVDAGNVHNAVVYFTDGTINYSEVTLVSSTLDSEQIPKFAPIVYDDKPVFYYVTDIETIDASTFDNHVTVYMTATPSSYDSDNGELTVVCDNDITVTNNALNTKNKVCAEITSYFCSVLIGCNQNDTNVYFDSVTKYFSGNTGYITSDTSEDKVRYVPFGHKIDYCNDSLDYKFSILMNFNNISNISVTLNSDISGNRQSNIGTVINEWNSVDGKSNICVNDYRCLFKNTDNTVSLVEIKKDVPHYRIILDRYIVFETPHYINIFDTQRETFYHAFNDYNNRIILCEKYGDDSISQYPSHITYKLSTPSTYLYASAINANMEVNNIYFSSIEYNPSIIENGRRDKFNGEFKECGEQRYNEVVDAYWDTSDTATTVTYKKSFSMTSSYYDNSLNRIPYPVSSNGNILYSANIFTKFINSYSNKDFVINDTVGYPLTYINNQPTLNYYFLSGIEYVNSAFILQGMNFINTDKMIFSVNYDGDVITYTEPLVSIQGFKFLGNTTKCAFYYSSFTKSIYGFLGDRTLNKLIDCSSIQNIQNIFFNPKEYKIYVITKEEVVVIDEDTMYTINIPNVSNMSFTEQYIILNIENSNIKSHLLTYYSATNKSRLPLKLKTQYYGIGNNIKSIIDCIYIRFFYDYGDDFDVKGDIKISVNTLTDVGKKSENKVISVLPSMWDKETKTYYLRYQPMYQECVGMELSIESPFAIATIDFGYSSDNVLQVSKYNA